MALPHRLTGETVQRRTVSTDSVDSGSDQSRSMDADGVAVRAIARYNVERRQAGEVPLDLKGIERLRHIITETVARHGADAKAADAH